MDVYVVGGVPFPSVNEKYRILADAWTSLTAPPFDFARAAYDVHHSSLFFATLTFFSIYSPLTDSWTNKTPMPTSREKVGGVILHNHFYVVGGVVSTFERYCIVTDTWTTLTNMPIPRVVPKPALVGHGVAAQESMIVAAGGSSSVHKYFFASDYWTAVTSFPNGHHYALGFSLPEHNTAYFLGGSPTEPGTPSSEAMMKYYVDTDVWTTVTARPLAQALPAIAVAVVSGFYHAFIFGGKDGAVASDVHTYIADGATAGVEGDPIFTTFMGQRVHLDLHTGVYQLLSTATFVVNMLVDRVTTLPPEEDLVIVMVGIVSNKPSPYMVDCGCGQDDNMVCNMRGTDHLAQSHPTFFSIDVDGFTMRVSRTWLCSWKALTMALWPSHAGCTCMSPHMCTRGQSWPLVSYLTSIQGGFALYPMTLTATRCPVAASSLHTCPPVLCSLRYPRSPLFVRGNSSFALRGE